MTSSKAISTLRRIIVPVKAISLIISVALLNSDTLRATPLYRQSATADLSGTVIDQSRMVMRGVNVTATSKATGVQRQVITNEEGYFTIPLLPPGVYALTARCAGFSPLEISDIILNVNDQRIVWIQMKVGNISESVTVSSGVASIKAAPAIATIIDRQFIENLPLNGRSFHTLLELTPGVVLTKATFGEQGQFSVNGQRANANYFMVDGVSANIGVSAGFSPNQHAGGSLPAFTTFGSTSNLVSVDALQEFRVQTSTYAPEFGRTPGAQVSIVTRSGTNDFHGTLFDYFRNEKLDANDWFSNNRGLSTPPLRQNDFGGVISGPIVKNQAFFFFSFEGLRLRRPQTTITEVPSREIRRIAPANLQPFFNAFPLPNGKDFGSELAEFAASYSTPSYLNASGLRLDYIKNAKLAVFGRYNHSPSETDARAFALSTLNKTRLNTQTLTVGLTQSFSPNIHLDFRANWSETTGGGSLVVDDFGGAVPPPLSALFPAFASPDESQFGYAIAGTDAVFRVGRNVDNLQRQVNLIDTVSILTGTHQLKLGIDYRRLSPVFGPSKYTQLSRFDNITDALNGLASSVSISTNERLGLRFINLSAFAQDTWKVTTRMVVTFGLRWEYNPPPSGRQGQEPFTVRGLNDPSAITLAPQGTPLWKATYNNFAPRAGLAYRLSERQSRGLVLRGGFGIFYDLGNGQAANGIGGGAFPFARSKTLRNVSFPLDLTLAAPPALNLNPPFGTVQTFDSNLKLPRTYQWSFAVEQSLGSDHLISASYVATAGRKLLRQELLANPNPNFTTVLIQRNAANSDYHALQVQFESRLSRGLQALASYSWSHSIDNVSKDSSLNLPITKINPELDRGPSDFDVRHSLTAALVFDLPVPSIGRVEDAVLGGWSVNAILRGRSATPVNLISGDLFNVFGAQRPNLAGGPIFIRDPIVAGGKRINRAAFSIPPANRQGNLGRNVLRGFNASQLDLALGRRFNLTERFNLRFKSEVFNVLNHPNFADPNGDLRSGFFGVSTQMLGRSLGTEGATGGLSPLYQIGGPRSIQLVLKLTF